MSWWVPMPRFTPHGILSDAIPSGGAPRCGRPQIITAKRRASVAPNGGQFASSSTGQGVGSGMVTPWGPATEIEPKSAGPTISRYSMSCE